jgi:hypothetical protein
MQQHYASHQISHSHRYRMPDQPPGGFWWLPQTLYLFLKRQDRRWALDGSFFYY